MRIGKFGWAALVVVLVSGAWFFSGQKPKELDAQQRRAAELLNWDYREACPDGHLTEIVLGQASIKVALRAVDHITLKSSQAVPRGCPQGPIDANLVLFSGVGELADTYRRHGLRLMRLALYDPQYRFHDSTDIPTAPDMRITVDALGMIEDITKLARAPQGALARAYRLQLLDSAGQPDQPPIKVICSGDPQNSLPRSRYCFTTYLLTDDLLVHYMLRQDARTSPEERWDLLPRGPIKEPDGLIAIDVGVRSWIGEMRQ